MVIDACYEMDSTFAATSMRLRTLLWKQELHSEVNVRAAGCSEVTSSCRRCDCDDYEPSCSIDSCSSSGGLSSWVVSGSLGRHFVGAIRILKS